MRVEGFRIRKELLVLIAIAAVAVWIWCRVLLPGERAFQVVFLDVGQGDCIFIRTPGGHVVLIDSGSEGSSGRDVGVRTLVPFLRRQGVNRVDVVVVSHPHDDHVRGLAAVVRSFRIGMVLDPAIPHPSKSYIEFLSAVHKRRIPFRRAVRGQAIDFGDGVRADVLHPPAERLCGTGDDTNNNSVVLRMTCGRRSILFTGDAGAAAETRILQAVVNVNSDVLKAAHHGGSDATSDEWLDAVNPRIAVISVGRNNSYGHPSPEVVNRLRRRGIRTFRTDRQGAIICKLRDGRWVVKPWVQAPLARTRN